MKRQRVASTSGIMAQTRANEEADARRSASVLEITRRAQDDLRKGEFAAMELEAQLADNPDDASVIASLRQVRVDIADAQYRIDNAQELGEGVAGSPTAAAATLRPEDPPKAPTGKTKAPVGEPALRAAIATLYPEGGSDAEALLQAGLADPNVGHSLVSESLKRQRSSLGAKDRLEHLEAGGGRANFWNVIPGPGGGGAGLGHGLNARGERIAEASGLTWNGSAFEDSDGVVYSASDVNNFRK